MATTVVKKSLTATQMAKEYEKTARELHKLKSGAYCHLCGEFKSKTEFITSFDKNSKSGLSPICKDCMNSIVYRRDENGDLHEPNQDSLISALRYIDRPFINLLYEECVKEAKQLKGSDSEKDFAKIYFTKIKLKAYRGKTFIDSDFLRQKMVYADEIDTKGSRDDIGTFEQCKLDREETIRLLGYDPFIKENLADQPFLYSQLLGMLDSSEEANDDMMRVQSIISIVRMFLQQSKLDDNLAELMSDYNNIAKNNNIIKNLQESKTKLNQSITRLAQESCISLKNSKNATKGENTWTGKIKKIKDLNLRQAEVNGFDYASCKGFTQVADISNASIIKQLKLDESEYASMLAEQKQLLHEANRSLGSYKELNRILLRENLDLKDFLSEQNILPNKDLLNLHDVFSQYGLGLQGGESE